MGWIGRFAKGLGVLGLMVPPTTAHAGSGDDQRAKELAREGTNLFASGNAKAGEAKLEQAWALKKTADIAGNLGSVELELKEYDRAANHLSYCDRHLPVSTPKDERDTLHSQLAEVKKYVGSLALDVHPAGVEIDIDGVNAGLSPLEGPIFVNPGAHEIVAQRDGLLTKELAITIAATEEKDEKLVLDPAFVPHERRSPIPGAVMLGAGAVGVAVGATLLGLTVSKDREARSLGKQLVCAPTQMDAGCPNLAHIVSTRNTFVYGGWAAASGGLALSAAGVAYFAWPYGSQGKARVAVVPTFFPDKQAISVGGTF